MLLSESTLYTTGESNCCVDCFLRDDTLGICFAVGEEGGKSVMAAPLAGAVFALGALSIPLLLLGVTAVYSG